ncbi:MULTISPECIES: aromatic ring-hydroxylating dioxygenase subunit alpha [unclassified Microbacterium]|uniref:aromatic ring-hydroxylating dioxygenase subunit alpha n=1 Tax=unclassified Microbacterium TaxID=2609290 RepID=UPI001604E117|nr:MULTISPECIES: aromatic ring-hydroxylating dioxygenase subunit alpha [unclassified Microbacterium]QNA92144.1 aromatic ring-hydroxylating dioxygenase subunit alpha [Microbacterium sp. Se63.02b]QYM65402.1 aromatic ring-hydroxylating dioxygenase subunit alpha [Microbacterium sp. Se5.02b]
MDTGTAYGLRLGQPLDELAQVGPGTPYGEVLRRYWHPVAKVEDATTRPISLRVLGEELVLFRTRKGKAGLLHPRCIHRGASLFYGGVEDEGIRCCYHGWVFDTEGHCLEQPCEPELGLHRDRVRQPWYPVEEQYGLIWAYMGPPEKKPVLPRYDTLEELGDGEQLIVNDQGVGGGGPAELDFNWLQHWENVMDPFHVPILHARFSGNQFTPEMALIPEVSYEYTPLGVRSIQMRELGDGRQLRRVTEVIFPNLRVVASPKLASGQTNMIGWVVPMDDTHFRIFTVARDSDPDFLAKLRSTHEGKPWKELTDLEHQRLPGDYEAQKSQGAISLHSEDHLTTTDQGIAMIRRMMAKQHRAVAGGGDPVGVFFDDSERLVRIEGGNYFEGAPDAPLLADAVDD